MAHLENTKLQNVNLNGAFLRLDRLEGVTLVG